MPHVATIALLGHLPSKDNLNGLRSHDEDVVADAVHRFTSTLTMALPILQALGPTFRAAYSPATLRHVTSARLLAGVLRIPTLVHDSRLNNVDYGVFKGRPLAEVPPRRRFLDTPYPGGTSWRDVAMSWRDFFETRLRQHDGEAVLLAGQSGAAPIMLAHLCDGVPLPEALADTRQDLPFLDATDPTAFSSVWTYHW